MKLVFCQKVKHEKYRRIRKQKEDGGKQSYKNEKKPA